MKNNTESSKQALTQALRSLPQDDVLSEVRYHIRCAINKIEHVEKKRARRETTRNYHEKWQESLALGRERLADGVNNPKEIDPLKAIRILDQMINSEKQRLDQLALERQKKAQQQAQPRDYEDDDDGDVPTILG